MSAKRPSKNLKLGKQQKHRAFLCRQPEDDCFTLRTPSASRLPEERRTSLDLPASLWVLRRDSLGTDTQTWFHRSEQSSQRRREMRMSSKSKEHQNVESQVTSAPQGEAVNISAPDSPRLEAIRIRAYEIYIERGGQPGHDLDDWLQGERELEPKVRAANEGQ